MKRIVLLVDPVLLAATMVLANVLPALAHRQRCRALHQ